MGDARLILIGTRTVREVGERVGDDDGLRGGEPEVRALGPVGGGRYCFDEEGDDEDGVEGGGIVEPGTRSDDKTNDGDRIWVQFNISSRGIVVQGMIMAVEGRVDGCTRWSSVGGQLATQNEGQHSHPLQPPFVLTTRTPTSQGHPQLRGWRMGYLNDNQMYILVIHFAP